MAKKHFTKLVGTEAAISEEALQKVLLAQMEQILGEAKVA